MRRVLVLFAAFFGLASAGGLVLPFSGPNGRSISLAVADSVGAPSPILAGLTFPDAPWSGGWTVILDDLRGPAASRIAAEASGADWVLVGKVGDDGWLNAYLYKGGRILPARFHEPALLASWLALKLGKEPGPFNLIEGVEEVLQELLNGNADKAAVVLYDVKSLSAKQDEALQKQIRLLEGLQENGPEKYKDVLPAAVIDFWKHHDNPEQMSDAGVGRVWKAYAPLGSDDKKEARKRALDLLNSRRALDLCGAELLLRALDDENWTRAARLLSNAAPEMPFAWKELSFAAFEKGDGALAKEALEHAVQLEPGSDLFWTNLGWASYMTGDMPLAWEASLRAMAIRPSTVPAYNLGLFSALAKDYHKAFAYYRQALRLDKGNEVPMALKDLRDAGRKDLLFWQGFLLERSGRLAQAGEAFSEFLRLFPNHPLAEYARLSLADIRKARTELRLNGFYLGEVATNLTFGAGERVSLQLEATSNHYLPSGAVTLTVYDGNTPLLNSSTKILVKPFTTNWKKLLKPITVNKKGKFRLQVSYAGASASTYIQVGDSSLGRQLLSRGIIPTDLDGKPLLDPEELARPDGADKLIPRAVAAVRLAAPEAGGIDRLSQPLKKGRFAGKSVSQIMATADGKLLREFFEALVQNPNILGDSDVINAFANWLFTLQ